MMLVVCQLVCIEACWACFKLGRRLVDAFVCPPVRVRTNVIHKPSYARSSSAVFELNFGFVFFGFWRQHRL